MWHLAYSSIEKVELQIQLNLLDMAKSTQPQHPVSTHSLVRSTRTKMFVEHFTYTKARASPTTS